MSRPPSEDKTPAARLAELEANHSAAIAASSRASLRHRARLLAERERVPVPEWAAERAPRRGAAVGGTRRRLPESDKPPARRALVPSIPAELVAWRTRTPGSIVRVTPTAIELHALGAPLLRFKTAADAIAAVAR